MARLEPSRFVARAGTPIELRSPEVGEGSSLVAMVRRNLETSPHALTEPDEFTLTAEQEDAFIGEYLAQPRKVLIVAYSDGQPVGLLNFQVGARRRCSHAGEFGMALLPEFRSQGIGTRMVEALIAWAKREPGVEKIILRVHARNWAALGLYRKLGFREEGRDLRGVKLANGDYDDVLQMALFI
jgi:RimJ/RimL family protein N-acetyltransferase